MTAGSFGTGISGALGACCWFRNPGWREFLGHLGKEPLQIGPEEFCKEFSSRRARVKALLLDQRVLRGVGNIYADESLFRARLHPARIAASLTKKQLLALHRAVREILAAAIRFRGSSISDYVDAEGKRGEFQQRHRVYQRKGKACFRCREKIRRVIVAGRSSYFCPRCQPAPRARKKYGCLRDEAGALVARRKRVRAALVARRRKEIYFACRRSACYSRPRYRRRSNCRGNSRGPR